MIFTRETWNVRHWNLMILMEFGVSHCQVSMRQNIYSSYTTTLLSKADLETGQHPKPLRPRILPFGNLLHSY
jgi:hypothetical protein